MDSELISETGICIYRILPVGTQLKPKPKITPSSACNFTVRETILSWEKCKIIHCKNNDVWYYYNNFTHKQIFVEMVLQWNETSSNKYWKPQICLVCKLTCYLALGQRRGIASRAWSRTIKQELLGIMHWRRSELDKIGMN